MIQKVVAARLTQLDQGFLETLESFSKAARKADNSDLGGELQATSILPSESYPFDLSAA